MNRICFQAPPIYFMHVPKTAGRSVSEFLTTVYGKRNTASLKLPAHLGKFSIADLMGKRHISSHFGPGLYEVVQRDRMISFTMLRDPVERTVSHVFFHQRALRRGAPFSEVHRERMLPLLNADLATWLASAEARYLVTDYQTRHLGNSFDFRPYLKDETTGRIPLVLERPIPSEALIDGLDMGSVFNKARGQLESMAVVGLTEHFAESLELLCDLIGIPMPEQLPTANIGPSKSAVGTGFYRATLSPDLISRIEALNRYDMMLYQYAGELFAQQWSRYRARPRRTYCVVPRARLLAGGPGKEKWRQLGQHWPRLCHSGLAQGVKNWVQRAL